MRPQGSCLRRVFVIHTRLLPRLLKKLSNSSFYYLYNIWRIRKYLSRRCTETLVHAFITARIDYCNSLLYGLPDYRINKLQRIQNAAARLICHITPLLYDLHWLPVKFRIEFKILLITFQALKGLAPTYIDSLISIKSTSRYDLRSSNDSLLLSYPKPLSKATLGDRSFTYAAPKLWNTLPLAIRSVNTVNDFKGKLKTYLFSKAFFIKIRIVL